MAGKEYKIIFEFLSLKVLLEGISENQKRVIRRKSNSFCIQNNEIYFKSFDKKSNEVMKRLVIHEDKLERVMYLCRIESGGHLGINKTVAKVASKYYFPAINDEVKSFISKCGECQKQNKTKTLVQELQPVPCGNRDLIGQDLFCMPKLKSQFLL
ncbi:unnamed protein product [Mytilus edulis]|uniref:Integrase zinc-binding domain-containing protein n=1 Tax=Mytilus edulis TaxID=6550 RepID=A0A8S3UMT9_MYTED|nr:unnamed protein product [Mytilus edulis]